MFMSMCMYASTHRPRNCRAGQSTGGSRALVLVWRLLGTTVRRHRSRPFVPLPSARNPGRARALLLQRRCPPEEEGGWWLGYRCGGRCSAKHWAASGLLASRRRFPTTAQRLVASWRPRTPVISKHKRHETSDPLQKGTNERGHP